MIWVNGGIVPDHALKISALDRTFEHGLGLFETFRTWNGHATLMPRHIARMARSAETLGLEFDPSSLPDGSAVRSLVEASGESGDVMLRLTMSGGCGPGSPSTVWLRSLPLPAPLGDATGAVLVESSLQIAASDPLARHKTLNYWSRKIAHAEALAAGGDEALVSSSFGWGDIEHGVEGSRTNLFLVEGATLLTWGEDAPILPGIMRGLVLEVADREGISVHEIPWQPFQASGGVGEWLVYGLASEVFLTNSVRGIIPVRSAIEYEYRAPGPVTLRLSRAIRTWLDSGGDAT